MSIRTSLKKVLPPISITEQEALEAGDVWLEASIYQGKPDMHALRPIPTAKLSAQEQAFLDGPVAQVLSMVDDFALAKRKTYSTRNFRLFSVNKFFALNHT